LHDATNGKLSVLLIFHHDLHTGFEPAVATEALKNVPTIVFVGPNRHATSEWAHFLLPAAAWPEKEGTLTNFAGRVQRTRQAVEPLGDARPEWMILKKLSRALAIPMPFFEAEDVFKAIAREVPAFTELTYELIDEAGFTLGEKATRSGKPANRVPDKLRQIPVFE